MKPDPDGGADAGPDPNDRVKKRATEVISLLSSSSEEVSEDEDDTDVSDFFKTSDTDEDEGEK